MGSERDPLPEVPSARRVAVSALPAPARALAALSYGFSRVSLPLILAFGVVWNTEPIGLPQLAFALTILSLLPGLAAALLRRAFAGEARIEGDDLVVERPGLELRVPRESVAALRPWVVPLPESGASLRLRSGRLLRPGLATRDLADLVEIAAPAGSAAALCAQAPVAFAEARRRAGRSGLRRPAVKFGAFALFPTAVLFNAHQHIAFGGPLGEYHLLGLASYLRTFAVYFATVAIHLLLFASVWRGLAEITAFAATLALPGRARPLRSVLEVGCDALYYVGVPLLLALRFAA